MSPGDQLLVDQRIAQTEVTKALMLLLALHDSADCVELRAVMLDGRMETVEVGYSLRGVALGGFAE